VVGLSIALEGALRGWRVLVIEANQLGRSSSWAGAGILPAGATLPAQDPIEQLRSLSHRLHAEWATRLQTMTGIDTEYRPCGGLYVATSPGERATLAANRHWWQEHGIAFDRWNAQQVLDRAPALGSLISSHPETEFWFAPEDCRVRNPRHLAALIAACRSVRVEFLEQTRVVGWESRGNRIVAVHVTTSPSSDPSALNHSTARSISGDRVCITSGAWSGPLLRDLGIETGIMPVRGQMVLYRCTEPPFDMVIHDGNRYLVPRDDGHLLAGSCEEEVGFHAETTDSMIEQLRAWAESLWPGFRETPVEGTWAGLRPGSFDSFPYLGGIPPWENAYVAAGHFRHGLHWSTATALLMVQCMAGERTTIDLAPFCVQRGRTNHAASLLPN